MNDAISRLERMLNDATSLMDNGPEHMREYLQGRVDQALFSLEAVRNIRDESLHPDAADLEADALEDHLAARDLVEAAA